MPHDYGVALVLHEAADFIVPSGQTAALRSGVERFLLASATARVDVERAARELEAARAFQQSLPEPSASLLRLVNDRDVSALGARLVPYLGMIGQESALSPDRSDFPSAPVYLLHGADDNVIPAVEAELLATELRQSTQVHLLTTGVLAHAELARRPTPAEAWQLITFWKSLLAED
jgi:hypothetical protein